MSLTKNMGNVDRVVRLVIAAVIAALYFTGQVSGLTATILALVAVIFVVTSSISFCPLYAPFGLKTRKE